MLICCQHLRAGNTEKKNEVVAKPNSEENKKFPDLINNHRIKLHLSITLSDLSRGDNPSIYKAQPPTF